MSTTPLETHELEIAREIQSRLFPAYLRHIMGLDYYGDCQPPVRLEPGDLLVAFTDGITEALDTGGRELRDTGVLEIVRRWPDARACDLVGEIMQAAGWLPAYSMPDDRTVIVVRYTAAAERSFYERRTRTTFALAAA